MGSTPYSHHDRDLKEALETHFAPLERAGKISLFWSDDHLTAGTEFDPRIREELETSQIVLLLLSAYYVKSDYCWNVEARMAMDLNDAARLRLVPVLLSDLTWQVTRIKKYTLIPRNLIPITRWQNLDEALCQVVDEVNRVVDELEKGTSTSISSVAADAQTSVTRGIFHCVPLVDDPVRLRAAGIAEMLGDVVLQFRGEPGARRIADIRVYANTNMTSRIDSSGLSEATLLLATGQCVTRIPTLGLGIRAMLDGVNSLAFLHVPLHELRQLPEAERNLRISNVRVNANQLGFSSSAEPQPVRLYVTVSDTTVTSPTFTVGYMAHDVDVTIRPAEGASLPVSFRQAQSVNHQLISSDKSPGSLSLIVRFTGRLAGYEQVPGERTRLMLRFWAVPHGVCLFATTEELTSDPSQLSARLTTADANGAGAFVPPPVHGYAAFENRSIALAQIPLDDEGRRQGLAVWEIENAAIEATTVFEFGIAVAYQALPQVNLPGLGSAWVNGSLAPLTTVTTASAIAPTPRFADTSSSVTMFSIDP